MTYFKNDEDREIYYKFKKMNVLNVRVNSVHLSSLDYLCEYFTRLYGYKFNRSMAVRKLIEDEYFWIKFQRIR